MSVLTFSADDLFVIRVIKSHHNNPSDQWANSYEFQALSDGAGSDLVNLALVVVSFEVNLHKNLVDFQRFTASTWEADSVPYDPTTFMSVTITDVGNVGVVGGVAPLNECWSVARVATSGRLGHLFYRGALDTADLFSPAGKDALVDPDDMNDRVQAAVTASGLDDYLGAAPSELFVMSMVSKDGTQIRRVQGLASAGVSFLPLDHAWFNRTPAP